MDSQDIMIASGVVFWLFVCFVLFMAMIEESDLNLWQVVAVALWWPLVLLVILGVTPFFALAYALRVALTFWDERL